MIKSNTIYDFCLSPLQATQDAVDAVARSFASRSSKAAPLYYYPALICGYYFSSATRKMDALVYGSPRALPNLTERKRLLRHAPRDKGLPIVAVDGWGISVVRNGASPVKSGIVTSVYSEAFMTHWFSNVNNAHTGKKHKGYRE